MRVGSLFLILLCLLLFSSGCGPAGVGTEVLPTREPASPTPSTSPTLSPTEMPTIQPGDLSAVAEPALKYLSGFMSIPASNVTLKSQEAVEWSDSCLGAALPEEMCAQVITPGYKLVFDTPDGEVEVHTDESGKSFRVLSAAGPQIGQPIVMWERSGGFAGICQRLIVGATGNYLLQDCASGTVLAEGILPAESMNTLQDLINRYGLVEWETTIPEGSADMFQDLFILFGQGSAVPSAEEQQVINEQLAEIADELKGIAPESVSGTGTGEAGIEGHVSIGPACPGPVSAEQPCPDAPYQATITILDQAGAMVAQVQSGSDGQFQVSLPPGSYTLRPESSGAYPRSGEQVVIVEPGKFVAVQVTYDSGIR